jgi:predicted DNA-binding protein
MHTNQTILVRLPAELKIRLEQMAKANSRSLSGEVMHMIKERLEATSVTPPNQKEAIDANICP